MNTIKILPSILTVDFADIKNAVKELENAGADILHLDVMDGVFVPNITFGIKMVADIKKEVNIPLDAHLMIVHPEKYIENFKNAGADYISVHYETCKEDTGKILKDIKCLGVKAGLAFNPDTEVSQITPYIKDADFVLAMSVFPGFGGQKFIENTIDKVKQLKEYRESNNLNYEIEIDGGINLTNVKAVKEAGVTMVVAGNTIIKEKDKKAIIEELKK